MKVEELRIGNYYLSYGVDLKQIEHLTKDKILIDFHPISLTEEWLLKFGFKKCKVLGMYPDGFILEGMQGSTFYLRPSYEGGYYWGFYTPFHEECELYSCKPIKEVHILQNLIFALSGTELTIK